MWERCLSRGALGSTLPVLYNSGIDITQGPGFVAIRYEMVHDQRIIPLDGRPHFAGVPQYMGDARGRWEGDTLVVETTNFTDRSAWASAAAAHRQSFDATDRAVHARCAGHDPVRSDGRRSATWTAPWTVAFPLTRMPDTSCRIRVSRGKLRPAQRAQRITRGRAEGDGQMILRGALG